MSFIDDDDAKRCHFLSKYYIPSDMLKVLWILFIPHNYPNEVGILLVPHFISEYSLRKIK